MQTLIQHVLLKVLLQPPCGFPAPDEAICLLTMPDIFPSSRPSLDGAMVKMHYLQGQPSYEMLLGIIP